VRYAGLFEGGGVEDRGKDDGGLRLKGSRKFGRGSNSR
jgi:hypothetical protein